MALIAGRSVGERLGHPLRCHGELIERSSAEAEPNVIGEQAGGTGIEMTPG